MNAFIHFASIKKDRDLFAIIETGCNESISNAELVLPDYTILRCDRSDGRKQGGVWLLPTLRFEQRLVTS
jgi:hypothetical protein